MAKKFLTGITIATAVGGEYTFPIADGSANQAIITDGNGNLSFGSAIASSAEDAQRLVCEMINASGSTIGSFVPVCCVGIHSDGTPEIAPARSDNPLFMPAIGITQSSVGNNNRTDILLYGKLEGVDTTPYATGDTLYVAPTGGWSTTRPTGNNLIQAVFKVGRIQQNNGSGGAFGAGQYEDLPNIGENKVWLGNSSSHPVATSLSTAISSVLGYTPANPANIPTRTETVFTATANQSVFTVNYTVGSVEVFYNGSKMAPAEFTATNGTSITLASGIPENTILTVVANGIGGGASKAAFSATAPMAYDSNTGVFSIPAATGSQNGYLTSANWTTFNNKQNALTLTVTGSSGAASLTGATLNIPTYTLAGLGGQPALSGTGFVKISGTTISYDNSTYYTTSGGTISGIVNVNGDRISSGTLSVRAGGGGGVGWGTGINLGDSSNYTSFIQDAGVSRWRNFGTGGFDYYGSGGGFLMSLSNSGALVANNDVTAYSDARLKTNIKVIPNALEKIMKIDGVTYERIDDDSNKRHTGVLAQQVLEVLPEAVLGSEDTIYSVAYGNMGGLFIEAIKELKKENNELRDILKRNNLI
jgi:hypothetical protein